MISDKISLVPIENIIPNYENRRAIDEDHVQRLANSIAQDDLIHTLTVEEGTNKLCAGGHRLRAWKVLKDIKAPCLNPAYENWALIPVRYAKDYAKSDLARIELIENIQHKNLDWQVEIQGIKKIHELQKELLPEWSNKETALLLGLSESQTDRSIRVAPSLSDPDIFACPTLTSAYNIIKRQDNRSKAEAVEKIVTGRNPVAMSLTKLMGGQDDSVEELELGPEPEKPDSPILLQSFHDFAKTYEGVRFNFLHCDFPYGLNISKWEGQSSRKDVNKYEDTPEIYWKLLQSLADNQNRLLSHSCHIMFWFSQKFRKETEYFFAHQMSNFFVQPFVMVWFRSDSSGLCPDPQRYGRRNYETCFLLTSGDRKIVRVKNLAIAHQGRNIDNIHKSEKPLAMVRTFMEMFVDENTIMLDPTCGSGTSLRAAFSLGAKSVVGLENDPEMQEAAAKEWVRTLNHMERNSLDLSALQDDAYD